MSWYFTAVEVKYVKSAKRNLTILFMRGDGLESDNWYGRQKDRLATTGVLIFSHKLFLFYINGYLEKYAVNVYG